jgi:hypothetical protein
MVFIQLASLSVRNKLCSTRLNGCLIFNHPADKFAQFGLNAPKWTTMEPSGKYTFGFYNARSTWEFAVGKVYRKLNELGLPRDETIVACGLVKTGVIKKRD